ncbi:cytochrome P450 [Mycena maculata]|uniref:Cytochrome P450 n=1 Tax=Mycena maculata TaxID=230809 RepID=A0AAD7I5X3_9AGAR|nr:cytochrome P450 [Mycena maculata]
MHSQTLLPIVGTLICYGLSHILQLVYRKFTYPLRHVSGPKNSSFIFGNYRDMLSDTELMQKWRNEYGRNFLFKGLFSITQLHTSDIKAVTHVLNNTVIYQRTGYTRDNRRRLFGDGTYNFASIPTFLKYPVQNQAFGVAQVRLMTEGFVEKSIQLRDIWVNQITEGHKKTSIDVFSWLSRMTLDVIGQEGETGNFRFNYHFGALDANGKPSELNLAINDLFHSPNAQRNFGFLFAQSILAEAISPIINFLPVPGNKAAVAAREKMDGLAGEIISESKASIKASAEEKTFSGRKDLLSVLLKANLSVELPENHRMSDAEVISQIPGFFVAGHETTSSAVSWALHALSLNIAVQSNLREELFTISTEHPTMDELNSLPYLESVVRETMRVHSPVVFVDRQVTEDDVLPLSKPYTDKQGKSHDSIPIPKGQIVHISIAGVNTDKDIWGDDASIFKPERWDHIPDAVSGVPGVWANLPSFLAGPHNCIGFRFSLVEIKALLFTLIRAFEFNPAKEDIAPTAGFLQRPRVLSAPDKGSSLPLIVTPYRPGY